MAESLAKNMFFKRSGALAKKLGMCRMKVDNKMVGVTLLHLENCKVLDHVQESKRGYNAVVVSVGNSKNTKKPQKDQKYAVVKEFRVNALDGAPEVGSDVKASYFELGQKVDVVGVSKGKGFQGGMKAHNFHGLRATHGVSVSHRSLGSTGNRTEPGRVFPGRKMPKRLGCDRVSAQNMEVVYVSDDHNVVGVVGGVPGSKNKYVQIRDTVIGHKVA